MTNVEIANILREMSLYYAMDSVPWKPAAYEKAATAVEVADYQMSFRYEGGGVKALEELPGVGPGIAKHIEALLRGKEFVELRAYRKKYPVHLLELTAVAGMGPKTVKLLYEEAGVRDVDDLERLARRGKLHGLPGIGAKTEKNILDAVLRMKKLGAGGRRFLGDVLPVSRELEKALRAVPGVKHAVVAGSVRRMQETIGDIDILVTTSSAVARRLAEKAFTSFPQVAQVLEKGETKITARLTNGMQADIRFINEASFGAALQYFTGDKHHNVEVRKIAISKGLKLNEYGLWKGTKRIAASSEEAVYERLGLTYMPPELRTASGEIEAAQGKKGKYRLPKLLAYTDVRGDLQVQTSWTDGENSIEAMAREAMRLGREYIAITDHSQALAFANGLTPKRLLEQGREIDRLNVLFRREPHLRDNGFMILKGIECDILKSGKLDLPDSTLEKLDVVGASIHSAFHLPRAEQTARLIRAMEHPHVDVIFHPTGRRLLRREEYDLDMDAVFKAARATGTALEINGSDRMDLRDVYVRRALGFGVKFIINSDAHSLRGLGDIELATAQARRGWATARDVVNTQRLKALLVWLKTPKHQRKG